MSGARPADILRHLAGSDAEAPDRDLLRRYVSTRDHAAFAELVRRHGPVVLAACRRGTFRREDAEDSFQAVFLILARRAGAVGQPELLGNWLYRVAVRVARDARRAAARRRVREVQGVDAPEPIAPNAATREELGPVLDEELEALPAFYRDAVVLCDLRGVPRADAAAQLGIPLGTLSSRLDAARKKLAARLVRRGVTLSVGAVLVEARAVALPEVLLSKTCEVVAVWSAGGALPQSVLKLTQRGFAVRRTMFLGLAAVFATTVVGVGLSARPEPSPQPTPPLPPAVPTAAAPEAQPEPKKAGDAPVKLGPPRLKRKEDLRLKDRLSVAWSPNGARLAVSGRATAEARPGVAGHETEWVELDVITVGAPARERLASRVPDGGRLVGFTADGERLLTQNTEVDLISGSDTLDVWSIADGADARPAVGRTGMALDLPDRATGFVAVGGQVVRFLVPDSADDNIKRVEVHGLSTQDGQPQGPFAAVTGTFQAVRLSPDGSRVVAVTAEGVTEMYGAVDGKKLWASGPPPAPPKDKVFGWPGPKVSKIRTHIAVARDGSRVLAGRNTPFVLAADTGKALPPLEGIEWVQGLAAAVSSDGRLAALSYIASEHQGMKAGPKELPLYGPGRPRLTVWETATGKMVRSWQGSAPALAFHPSRPVLAVLEPHGTGTRLGLWDFAAQP